MKEHSTLTFVHQKNVRLVLCAGERDSADDHFEQHQPQGGCASMCVWTQCMGSWAVKQPLCIHCWGCCFSAVLVTKKHHGRSSLQPFTDFFWHRTFICFLWKGVQLWRWTRTHNSLKWPVLNCSHFERSPKIASASHSSDLVFSELLSSQLDLMP